jgi:hypothetical protein
MSKEWLWICMTSITLAVLLWRSVPIEQIRIAWLSFLSMQVITWGLGAIIIQNQWIVCPVRLFPQATSQDFFADYVVYPSICVICIQHYPKHSFAKKFIHIAAYSAVIAIWDWFVETFTDLQEHLQWHASYHFFIAIIALSLCRWLVHWYFQISYPRKDDQELELGNNN